MSKQSDYYYRHKADVLRRLRMKRHRTGKNIGKNIKTGKNTLDISMGTNYDDTPDGNQAKIAKLSRQSKKIRMHTLAVRFNLCSSFDTHGIPASTDPAVALTSLRGHTDAILTFKDGAKGRLTSKSLTLWAREVLKPLNTRVLVLERGILDKLFTRAEIVAQRLNLGNLEASPDGLLVAKVRAEHIALVNNEIAQIVLDNNAKLITHDPDDGKARVIVDASQGWPEFEAIHNRYAPFDAQELADFATFVYTKGLKQWMAFVQERDKHQTDALTYLANQVVALAHVVEKFKEGRYR